jgi:acyl-coenzyme A thioesterase PaaI-like protein
MSVVIGNKTSSCYVCGPDNALGLRVHFEQDGAEGSSAHYTARPEHGGWNGILHGGITFSLMDEALGWALFFQGKPSVTARVHTRFNRPIPIGTRVVIRAWIIRARSRTFEARAEVRSDEEAGTLFAEADATMYRIPETQALSQGQVSL